MNVPNYEYFNSSPFAELEKGYVIGATPFALRTNRLSGIEFETVIFDEASQITLPLAIMGMLSAKRFVFIGDPTRAAASTRAPRCDRKYPAYSGWMCRIRNSDRDIVYVFDRELEAPPGGGYGFYALDLRDARPFYREAAQTRYPFLV